MSGKDCFNILEKMFLPKTRQSIKDIKGYTIKYGNIIEGGQIIDEVLVAYFKAPKSYTKENMCEINSHGGNIIVKRILELCLKNGAQLAEPGEFTKRAFLNGRIDLLQAESVIDVIHAKSEREAKTGIKQLQGKLSKQIGDIKQQILDRIVQIEVTIDYPEYDVEELTNQQILDTLNEVEKKLTKLENSFENGKIIKEGIKTAIIGKPNAGKSSLLNAMLQEERAIVTEYEGTTRDTIEEMVSIEGIPLKLIDTAGIRQAKDEVEKIGIAKSRKIAKEADLVIGIFDGTKKLEKEDEEILEILEEKKAIIILNKNDLRPVLKKEDERLKKTKKPIVSISALNGSGMDELTAEILNLFHLNEINLDHEVVITNVRHKNLIMKAIQKVKKAQSAIQQKMPVDIVEIFMKDILEDLGKITGEEASEEIINEIFAKFCLGK